MLFFIQCRYLIDERAQKGRSKLNFNQVVSVHTITVHVIVCLIQSVIHMIFFIDTIVLVDGRTHNGRGYLLHDYVHVHVCTLSLWMYM